MQIIEMVFLFIKRPNLFKKMIQIKVSFISFMIYYCTSHERAKLCP